jgi:phage gp45-like
VTGPSVAELAKVTSAEVRRLAGMVRRLVVSATSSPIWKLLGVRGLDSTTEVINAEVFSGLGFYARPPTSGGSPEVILLNVGDARVPVVIASRDEKTLAAVRAELGAGLPAAGDTLVFAANGSGVVYLKANGTVEIKAPGGTASPVATLADLQALRTAISGAVIAPGDGGAALKAAMLAASWTTGTSVLKGE